MAAPKAHGICQTEERPRLGDLWQDHDLVFANSLDQPLDHNDLYRHEYERLLD